MVKDSAVLRFSVNIPDQEVNHILFLQVMVYNQKENSWKMWEEILFNCNMFHVDLDEEERLPNKS